MKYVLVDYENVQEKDLEPLLKAGFSVNVFVGNQQTKVPTSMMLLSQSYKKFWLEQIVGTGKNALDFHIAFAMGEIYKSDAEAVCYVISKDTGFDPLVAKVNKSYGKNRCFRVEAAEKIFNVSINHPKPKKHETPKQTGFTLDSAIKLISKMHGLPKKRKNLVAVLIDGSKPHKINKADAEKLIDQLIKHKKVELDSAGKLVYKL